jgi:hypothetical protein
MIDVLLCFLWLIWFDNNWWGRLIYHCWCYMILIFTTTQIQLCKDRPRCTTHCADATFNQAPEALVFALRSRSQGLSYSKTSVEAGISTLPTLFLVLSHWTVCIWLHDMSTTYISHYTFTYSLRDWLYSLHGMHVFATFLSFAIPIPTFFTDYFLPVQLFK